MRKLNVHYLKKRLDSLCDILEKDYNINEGGCCFVASVIAQNLDRLGIKYKLVIYDDRFRDVLAVNHEVYTMNICSKRNSITRRQTCYHYAIQIIGAGVVNGEQNYHYNIYLVEGISARNIYWIYKNGYWNEEYNIYNNRKVRKIINAFFHEYD